MKLFILLLFLGIFLQNVSCGGRRPLDTEVEAFKAACSNCYVQRISVLQNWAKTETLTNIIKVSPRTKDELSNVILKSTDLGLTMRVIGTRHSWSPLFPDSGNVALDLRQLQCHDGPQVELVDVDGTPAIRIMSGMTIQQLLGFQVASNFSVDSNVLFTVPTVGGVFSAGCHGAAVNRGPVGDFLLKVRLMDSSGNLREFTKSNDTTVFPALQTSLGVAGVLYDVTIAATPTRVFRRENLFFPVSELTAAKLVELTSTSHSLTIFWFPFNSITDAGALQAIVAGLINPSEWDPQNDLLWIVKVTEENVEQVPEGQLPSYVPTIEDILQTELLGFTDDFLAGNPRYTPLLTRTYLQILRDSEEGKTVIEYTPAAVHWRPLAEKNPVLQVEWLIPTDTTHTQSFAAVQYLVQYIQQAGFTGQFPINLAAEMRFIQAAQHPLNPAISATPPDVVMGLGALSVLNTRGFPAFADDYAAYARSVGGLPHWAKLWSGGADTVSHIKGTYNISGFKAALSFAGLDPQHFSNVALRDIFSLN